MLPIEYHSVYDDIYWMNNFGDPTYKYFKACAQFWGLMALKLVDSPVIPLNYTNYGAAMLTYYNDVVALVNRKNHTVNLQDLQAAITLFVAAANSVHNEIMNGNRGSSLNDRLVFTERMFLSDSGLPKRPYYKHVIQAPGLYEGYAARTFPGLYEAIQAGDWGQASIQNKILTAKINNAASFLAGAN